MADPAISIVVVTDHFATIRRVVEDLQRQTIRDQIELVVVAPSRAALELDATAVAGLPVTVVEVGSIMPMPRARAAGVGAASAAIVFLGETHSYPAPDFCEVVVGGSDIPWDVLVPGLDNANPGSPHSWSSYLADYGYWHHTLPAGWVASGPTWNVAYRREALLSLGRDLQETLAAGDRLHARFRAAGRRWYHEPRARLRHANVSVAPHWSTERILAGRLTASNRSQPWSLVRRLGYVLAAPLIVIVLHRRIAPALRSLPPATLPAGSRRALWRGLLLRTVGEIVGYSVGATAADVDRMEEYELHKLKYTLPERDAGPVP
jgi:hypothetical protein